MQPAPTTRCPFSIYDAPSPLVSRHIFHSGAVALLFSPIPSLRDPAARSTPPCPDIGTRFHATDCITNSRICTQPPPHDDDSPVVPLFLSSPEHLRPVNKHRLHDLQPIGTDPSPADGLPGLYLKPLPSITLTAQTILVFASQHVAASPANARLAARSRSRPHLDPCVYPSPAILMSRCVS